MLKRLMLCAAMVILISATAVPAQADRCARLLRRMEGWTIISVTNVDGEFEGCDHGKRIKMANGAVYTCAEYNYTYAYSPDAIVFGKKLSLLGRTYISIKILVEGELMEMQLLPAKE